MLQSIINLQWLNCQESKDIYDLATKESKKLNIQIQKQAENSSSSQGIPPITKRQEIRLPSFGLFIKESKHSDHTS